MNKDKTLAFPAHISGVGSDRIGFEGEQLAAGMMADYSGMYLRDYFAAKALQGALAYSNVGIEDKRTSDYAKYAYSVADAMLAERAK